MGVWRAYTRATRGSGLVSIPHGQFLLGWKLGTRLPQQFILAGRVTTRH